MIWSCHVHLETVSSERIMQIQEFMRSMVERYHASIFSTFQFLPLWLVPSFIIPPFIDPLSDKNRELPPQEVEETLERYGINPQKPLITQV